MPLSVIGSQAQQSVGNGHGDGLRLSVEGTDEVVAGRKEHLALWRSYGKEHVDGAVVHSLDGSHGVARCLVDDLEADNLGP